jgi:hypothetical protein
MATSFGLILCIIVPNEYDEYVVHMNGLQNQKIIFCCHHVNNVSVLYVESGWKNGFVNVLSTDYSKQNLAHDICLALVPYTRITEISKQNWNRTITLKSHCTDRNALYLRFNPRVQQVITGVVRNIKSSVELEILAVLYINNWYTCSKSCMH